MNARFRSSRPGRPVLVTRFGEPIAEIVPPRRPRPADRFLAATALTYDLVLATAEEAIIRAKPCAVLSNR